MGSGIIDLVGLEECGNRSDSASVSRHGFVPVDAFWHEQVISAIGLLLWFYKRKKLMKSVRNFGGRVKIKYANFVFLDQKLGRRYNMATHNSCSEV